jgi:hypothetical protein
MHLQEALSPFIMPIVKKKRSRSCSVPLPFFFLLVACLFIYLETTLFAYTEISHPQSYSSGALLRSNTAAKTASSGAWATSNARIPQPPTQTGQSNIAEIQHVTKTVARLQPNTASIRQPLTQNTDSSGAPLQSATRSATIQKHRPAPPVLEKKQLRVLGTVSNNTTKHTPSYFFKQVALEKMKMRMNILTPYTGCSIAAFQYNLLQNPHPEFNDCFCHRGKKFGRSRGLRADNAERLVKEGDTIYVQFNKLQHFVGVTLPHIQHEFVLISGQEQKVEPFSKEAFDAIVANPKVIQWFMMNMDIYSYDPRHPKVRTRIPC